MFNVLRTAAVTALTAAVLAAPASAQEVLERTPNISGGWNGAPGVVHFHLLHRFWQVNTPAEDGSEEKVLNSPTLLFAYPVLEQVLVGVNYSSNANLGGDNEWNEWEFLARWTPLSLEDGAPVQLGLTAAYNQPAGSGDAAVAVAYPLGPMRVLGTARVFSEEFVTNDSEAAVGVGVTYRLSENVALAADVISLLDRAANQEIAWSAGLQLQIPTTPHTVSFQATNTRTGSLQGSSWGDGETRYGFELTIPFTLSRYFGRGERGEATAEGGGAAAATTVEMTDGLIYEPESIRVSVGDTVTWRNSSRLVHTVTADPDEASDPSHVRLPDGAAPFDSGNISPGGEFRHTFEVPGEYRYFCIPHEAAGMVGTVIVEE